MNAIQSPSTEDPRLSIGGNQPPLKEVLTETYTKLLTSFNKWIGSAKRAPDKIESDDEATGLGLIVKNLRDIRLEAAKYHKTEKEPFLEQGRIVDTFFNAEIISVCNDVEARLTKRQSAYLNVKAATARKAAEEQARREQEEAEALQRQAQHAEDTGNISKASEHLAEAAAAESRAVAAQEVAETKPSELAIAVGSGVRVKGTMKWVGTITDKSGMDLNELKAVISDDDLQKYVNSFVRLGGRSLKGVTIEEKLEARNR